MSVAKFFLSRENLSPAVAVTTGNRKADDVDYCKILVRVSSCIRLDGFRRSRLPKFVTSERRFSSHRRTVSGNRC